MITINKLEKVLDHLEHLRGVIFDLDDTLYGEKEYVRSGYAAIAALPELAGVKNMKDKLWTAFTEGKPAIDAVLEAENICDPAVKAKCLEAYRWQTPDIHLYPGAAELLDTLRARGLSLGIITDGRPEGQRAKIAALGLEDKVDAIIVTDELGGPSHRKPSTEAFEKMQQMLQIPFEQLCYVGDNEKKDPIAPKALGMRMLLFRNEDGLY